MFTQKCNRASFATAACAGRDLVVRLWRWRWQQHTGYDADTNADTNADAAGGADAAGDAVAAGDADGCAGC